ncbi:hypothetical protein C1646_750603 [Rhizophagus diaphanus]|nr:hypothetical protein C1646_750603 [Rhizophagus diaphanus] [Rhizophagus sp. MUCL 43196]
MRASLQTNDSDEINVNLVEMKDDLIESKSHSFIEVTENVLRELTRSIINEKWIKLFWNKRCEETIELEKTRGITKELKRKRGKKVIESERDEGSSGDEGKIKLKNSKKLKLVTKNMMLENSKDNVFRLININGDIK